MSVAEAALVPSHGIDLETRERWMNLPRARSAQVRSSERSEPKNLSMFAPFSMWPMCATSGTLASSWGRLVDQQGFTNRMSGTP